MKIKINIKKESLAELKKLIEEYKQIVTLKATINLEWIGECLYQANNEDLKTYSNNIIKPFVAKADEFGKKYYKDKSWFWENFVWNNIDGTKKKNVSYFIIDEKSVDSIF